MGTPGETETEAFARRLREIRDGSGRSYGALARRVGVSASTLHRYCSGSTVPMEFAPVERLARLCGCAGEEVISLHRLWVRADAERQRRQEGGARPASAPETETTVSTGTAATALEGATDDADPAETAGPQDRAAAALPAQKARSLVRRWVVRRKGYSAAASLAATVLAIALVMAFDQSPFAPADRDGASGQRAGDHGTDTSPPPDENSAPHALTTSEATPAPTASPTGTGRTGSGGRGSPRPGTKSTAPTGTPNSDGTGTPLTWSVNQHVWLGGCGHAYLVDRGPSAVPPPPTESDAEPWARSVGAVHAGDTRVRITVQGRSDTAVVLQAVQVRIVARRTPPAYHVYNMNNGCGGSLTPRLFDIDLDKPRPVAHSMAGNDAGEPIPAVSFPYRVSARDPEVLLFTGRTADCDCDWYLELEWSSGQRSGVVRVDDNGQPFRTSGRRGRPAYDYDSGSRRWIPAETTASSQTDETTASSQTDETTATEGTAAGGFRRVSPPPAAAPPPR
ncbi:helix-turn-helix transcriptional regulator [Streptomyces sp. AK02-01A]|uniref:helix-turn-helix domain-containing protein n=1 Tax=Streptomyces sp. AK02-01A TaxID=3028648 RepID=UPI0029BCE2B8|nr:helix-turn-helix transcriptional regulator [Streptomyces sp. AK02-01A]MDX3850273.1 helix-turn-helix transcriptional regulator [Streptomyces sp. AK02-01A]